MAGTGAPGGGGATTMLSSPGCPRVPVEVVGTRGAMGQEEQADVVEEPAVAAPLAAVERVVGCGERGGGGSRAACAGGRRFGPAVAAPSAAVERVVGRGERGGGGSRAAVRAGSCGGRQWRSLKGNTEGANLSIESICI
ncbi:unnamed protein product [Miscanthus lutarioriparius]|uniref:Uncharacterized protein n=1 Tax=Miscanthus lutarioriparius TaxID=422564 RepID=A0A811QUH5_9POAL|nr:unnamed protein product [Miscanthus lutarioriparius]